MSACDDNARELSHDRDDASDAARRADRFLLTAHSAASAEPSTFLGTFVLFALEMATQASEASWSSFDTDFLQSRELSGPCNASKKEFWGGLDIGADGGGVPVVLPVLLDEASDSSALLSPSVLYSEDDPSLDEPDSDDSSSNFPWSARSNLILYFG